MLIVRDVCLFEIGHVFHEIVAAVLMSAAPWWQEYSVTERRNSRDCTNPYVL